MSTSANISKTSPRLVLRNNYIIKMAVEILAEIDDYQTRSYLIEEYSSYFQIEGVQNFRGYLFALTRREEINVLRRRAVEMVTKLNNEARKVSFSLPNFKRNIEELAKKIKNLMAQKELSRSTLRMLKRALSGLLFKYFDVFEEKLETLNTLLEQITDTLSRSYLSFPLDTEQVSPSLLCCLDTHLRLCPRS